MPALRLILGASLVLLLVAAAPAAADDHLVLIGYGGNTMLRERLIRETSVFADLGGRVVARVNTAQITELRGCPLRPFMCNVLCHTPAVHK